MVCTYLSARKNKKKRLVCDFQGPMVLNVELICTSASTGISQQKLRHSETRGATELREDFVTTTDLPFGF